MEPSTCFDEARFPVRRMWWRPGRAETAVMHLERPEARDVVPLEVGQRVVIVAAFRSDRGPACSHFVGVISAVGEGVVDVDGVPDTVFDVCGPLIRPPQWPQKTGDGDTMQVVLF